MKAQICIRLVLLFAFILSGGCKKDIHEKRHDPLAGFQVDSAMAYFTIESGGNSHMLSRVTYTFTQSPGTLEACSMLIDTSSTAWGIGSGANRRVGQPYTLSYSFSPTIALSRQDSVTVTFLFAGIYRDTTVIPLHEERFSLSTSVTVPILHPIGQNATTTLDAPAEIHFRSGGKPAGTAQFVGNKILVESNDGRDSSIEYEEWDMDDLRETKVVDIGRDGNDDIFFVCINGGSGMTNTILSVLNPRSMKLISLDFTFFHDPSAVGTPLGTSPNFDDPSLAPERHYLDSVKYKYDFVDEVTTSDQFNPGLAYFFWTEENSKTQRDTLIIRKYPGPVWFDDGTSVNDQLTIGAVTFKAFFKKGVVAYNNRTKEEYIAFVPDYYYDWPTALAHKAPYLIIGTRGEGLAFINLANYTITRRGFGNNGKGLYVDSMRVTHSQLVVNGKDTIDIPEH